MKTRCLVLAAVLYMMPADAKRPNRDLKAAELPLACEGEFDVPPTLRKGKTPVMPVSMLSPGLLNDRVIKRLPLHWDVETTFRVDKDGKPKEIRSSATDPPQFARHMNAAVGGWRFEPASLQGVPAAARCAASMRFEIQYP